MRDLTERHLYLLSALTEAPLHGYGLVRAIESASNGAIAFDPTHLYRTLRTMRTAGWIREIETERDSRRRTYEITDQGRKVLRDELSRMEGLMEHLRPAGDRG